MLAQKVGVTLRKESGVKPETRLNNFANRIIGEYESQIEKPLLSEPKMFSTASALSLQHFWGQPELNDIGWIRK